MGTGNLDKKLLDTVTTLDVNTLDANTLDAGVEPTDDLLLDLVPGARYAYSTRKLKSDYIGFCMRVRNSIGTLLDIGFDVNGNLDIAALELHANGSKATVETWYDQSGNANNVIAAVIADEPRITTNSGIVDKMPSGIAAPRDDNQLSELQATINHGAITDFSAFSVVYQIGVPDDNGARAWGAQTAIAVSIKLQRKAMENDFQFGIGQSEIEAGTIQDTFTQVSGFAEIKDGVPDGELNLYQDGTLLDTQAITVTTPASIASPFCLFNNVNISNHWRGLIGEIIFYEDLKFTERTILEDNQKTYWGTP